LVGRDCPRPGSRLAIQDSDPPRDSRQVRVRSSFAAPPRSRFESLRSRSRDQRPRNAPTA
jgi:hypothetical protein